MLKHGILRWLDLSETSDRILYYNIWLQSASKRPHDHPNFLEMMKPAGYRPMAVVYQHSPTSRIIYPFYCCCLNDLPAFGNIHSTYMHLVSPYGYGGPLFEGKKSEQEEASISFEKILNYELISRCFVSEFVREDIFSARLACRSAGILLEQQPNVVVRLQRSDDDLWRTYKAKVRKNVKRANESHLQVVFDHTGQYLVDFIKIYYETMIRTDASKTFMIPKEKFRNLTDTLGQDGGVMYVHIFDGDTIVSTELLLLSQDTIYSFLGGTLESAYTKRPNDLLKHEAIRWGRENNFKWYVLGGGVTPADGIYRYKEAFDPESIFPFFVRRHIINHDAYQLLIDERTLYENSHGNHWVTLSDFFPEYLS